MNKSFHWFSKFNNLEKLNNYQQQKYLKDATRLALREISTNGNYDEIDPTVPEELVQSIYKALTAVHKSQHKKAIEVTKIHRLHTFPTPSVDQFFVVYERNASWAVPLRLGDNTTDSRAINQFLSKYKLVIDRHMTWDEHNNSFNVRATNSLNLAPLAKAFSEMENITFVDLLIPDGDGNDIDIKKINNGWRIHYYVKFETCITGCKKNHVWTFESYDNNDVKFIEEGGDDLPNWMKKNG